MAASRVQFFCSGFLFASWGVHIPTLRTHYGVDEAAIGIALLAGGAGTLLGLTQAQRVVGGAGPRRAAAVLGPWLSATLALLLHMPGYAGLLVLMVVFGLANGLFDLAINADASALEQRLARPVMSGLHALFSTGGMAGAAAGGALLAAGVAPWLHLAGVALLLAVVTVVASRGMATDAAPAAPAQGKRPWRRLLPLGLLAAIGLLVEGALYDWSVLYLQQVVGRPQAEAALGYAAFSAAMAAGRFGGDALRRRIAAPKLLAGSGALATAGMALALLWPAAPAVLAGFALCGLGLANVIPVLFARAGTVPGVAPAVGIAVVGGFGYAGLMAGPSAIGFGAAHAGLTAALWLVVAGGVVLALAAPRAVR